jgi:hypothetical protein
MDGKAPDQAVVTLQELASFLGAALGDAKAREVVAGAARRLGLGEELQRSEALRVLEHIADTESKGIVGVAARFAKSRLHLQWARTTSPPKTTR